MKKDSCIFCKLANGDIPTKTIYENDIFRVILDAGPATRGHALILPKDHYENIYDIPAEVAGAAMILAKQLASKMTEALHCDGFNLVQNNGEVAGQTVFHFHLHLIPRYKKDPNDTMIAWTPQTAEDKDMEELQTLLSSSCSEL